MGSPSASTPGQAAANPDFRWAPESGDVVFRIGGIEPRKLTSVAPIYPAMAKASGVSGVVMLQAVIDGAGNVGSVSVLRGHPMLDQAAIDAVQQWKYEPTVVNGRPASVAIDLFVNFQLRPGNPFRVAPEDSSR